MMDRGQQCCFRLRMPDLLNAWKAAISIEVPRIPSGGNIPDEQKVEGREGRLAPEGGLRTAAAAARTAAMRAARSDEGGVGVD